MSKLFELNKLKEKYPDKIPIIVKKSKNSSLDNINKEKFLVPEYMTIAQFNFIIRKRLQLKPEVALFLLYDNQLMTSSKTMIEVYNEHKNPEDHFLYATYTNENTFG